MSGAVALASVAAVCVATVGIGAYGLRLSRTTSDFYVASRSVSPWWNASAIGGEYLSAASFLGIAGLVLAYGADMLWFPVGYTAGYVLLLVLVAAPLRRSGAYTLPDFAELRLESAAVRRVASLLVLLIGWLYLLPQLQGAGLALHTVAGTQTWVGSCVVAAVVVLNVVSGGMRAVTLVQAFQYWLKLTALALPLVALLAVWHGSDAASDDGYPTFRRTTTVELPAHTTITVRRSVVVGIDGRLDGERVHARQPLPPGRHTVAQGTRLTFDAGSEVPHADRFSPATQQSWLAPLSGAGGRAHPLYGSYSLMLALFFGTMGLPHVLVRFYTNPDGRAARRTTVAVLALLGAFYLLPTVYGALGRIYAPELLVTGQSDATVLLLPARMVDGAGGTLLSALVTAGAFAAFLSTSSGLAVSLAGVLSQDVLRGGIRSFRLASVLAVAVPVALSFGSARLAVADVVGLAFAVAASTFCPLLVLGIWWRRLTWVGALSGLVVGGGLAGAAVLTTIAGRTGPGWTATLLAQPAAWTVPTAFAVMVVVSLATPGAVAPHTARTMVLLHTPESLALPGYSPTRAAGSPKRWDRTRRRTRKPAAS